MRAKKPEIFNGTYKDKKSTTHTHRYKHVELTGLKLINTNFHQTFTTTKSKKSQNLLHFASLPLSSNTTEMQVSNQRTSRGFIDLFAHVPWNCLR